MRNKLFTASVDKMLFKQYPLGDDLEKQKVVAKIFNPYGDGRWYLLNSDPEDPDYIWAIVSMFGNVEIGSVSRSELLGARIRPFGLPLERDLYFTPQNAAEVYRGLLDGKFYKKGGVTDDLVKELRKLQRDLNSSRLSTYKEGDNSAEEMARQAERAAKLARFDEVLKLLRESDAKFAKGGSIGNFKIGDYVYHRKHNTIGKVIDVFDRGDVRTDADGVVYTGELEIYDEGNPKHKKAHIAPSTQRELDSRFAKGGMTNLVGNSPVKKYPIDKSNIDIVE